jgi:mannosylglycerate hydrolase MGH1-like protein/glycosyl hydrolase family 63
MNPEQVRLEEARVRKGPWRKWGPYLSERQWGTVREDYSESGDAWNYFSHDHARSRAYRWGEDGLAGISDDRQLLCFALALWNGNDPILKERLFGLTNSEGNHGEDVKECYFYLDSTPTHSYLKYLYKYPQSAYPYDQLVRTNRDRARHEPEYELLDTGVFDDNRYFDVFVEYAKAGPEDILIQVTAWNRGPDPAVLHLLPTIWFRNTWSWGGEAARPVLRRVAPGVVALTHPELGDRFLYAEDAAALLFTENETNTDRLVQTPNRTPYVKDAFHNYLVGGERDAVNPKGMGTKAAAQYRVTVKAGASATIRLRLTEAAPASPGGKGFAPFGSAFDAAFAARRKEADEFYASVIPSSLSADAANVMRQALAGMLWSKQYYYYDVNRWLADHDAGVFRRQRAPRNSAWHHMDNADIISMPDKWEYPWYAAWDLAFHCLALTLVDSEFGKQQLDLMLQTRYQHPNGQLPAYEWNFGDVNPPVHAWATIFTYRLEKERGQADIEWLERSFHKLLLNFTWWVNRKDRAGSNVFEGGFLGLDNIGVFDRSSPLPTGGYLDQADGTAWMALFCQNMLEIATELARERPAYRDLVEKFVNHVLSISFSMLHGGDDTGMWDEEDGFFYDVLRFPDGRAQRLKVRSMVGLLPLCAVTVFDGELRGKDPELVARVRRYLDARPELKAHAHDPTRRGKAGRSMSAALNEANLRRVLKTMLDENEFLSPYGIRALSRHHLEHPFVFDVGGQEYKVSYLPGDSDSGMFGGNSNWRGPIWMPVNGLIVRALLHYYSYYGDDFTIECPTGSGRQMNLYQVAEEIARRLSSLFLRDGKGDRPAHAGNEKFRDDPHWRDLLLFYEYFHGDSGAGIGANHQTGWTGIIARMMHLFATTNARQVLELGKEAAVREVEEAAGAR